MLTASPPFLGRFTPHPGRGLLSPRQWSKDTIEGKSLCAEIKAALLAQTAPPSRVPVVILITRLFFKGLLSGRGIAHTLSQTSYIFLLTAALHQKRSKEGQEKKRKEATSQMNNGALGRGEGMELLFRPPGALDTGWMNQWDFLSTRKPNLVPLLFHWCFLIFSVISLSVFCKSALRWQRG